MYLFVFTFNTNGQILKDDLTIGTKADKIFFGIIQSIDVDTNGKIYVSDWQTKNVRVFSDEGKIVQKVGRSGRGPGEIQKISGSGINNLGELYTYDPNLLRVNIFSYGNSVEYLTSMSIPKLDNSTKYGSIPNDIFVLHNESSFILNYQTPYSPANGIAKRRENLVLFRKNGEKKSNSLLSLRADQKLVRQNAGSISVRPMPFGKRSLIEIGPNDHVFTAWTGELSIRKHDTEGEVVNTISDKIPSIKVTDSDIRRENKKLSGLELTDHLEKVPNNWPVFDWFEVDNKNRIWVAVNTEDRQNYSLRVYDQNGDKITQTSLPKTIEIKEIIDGYAYGIQQKKNDPQSIVRYKINID